LTLEYKGYTHAYLWTLKKMKPFKLMMYEAKYRHWAFLKGLSFDFHGAVKAIAVATAAAADTAAVVAAAVAHPSPLRNKKVSSLCFRPKESL